MFAAIRLQYAVDDLYQTTVFLLKIRHEYCFTFAEFLEVNIQHSVCVHVLFPFIAFICDDLYRKLETIFNHSVKGTE